MRKCMVCVRGFEEQNNGHYFCTTYSRPPEGIIMTACGMSSAFLTLKLCTFICSTMEHMSSVNFAVLCLLYCNV